jgi:hypothetical protein
MKNCPVCPLWENTSQQLGHYWMLVAMIAPQPFCTAAVIVVKHVEALLPMATASCCDVCYDNRQEISDLKQAFCCPGYVIACDPLGLMSRGAVTCSAMLMNDEFQSC